MPLIAYKCNCGHTESKYVRQVKDLPAFLLCPSCNSENMKKLLSAPTNSSKITVDNGVQARAVEIDPNIIEQNAERNAKDYTKED